MNLIRNERLKLLATYLNGMAIAIFAIGGLAPSFSMLYGNTASASAAFMVFVTVSCLIASAALHYVASLILKRLSP
jgi:uncharacterized membrane protein YkgB